MTEHQSESGQTPTGGTLAAEQVETILDVVQSINGTVINIKRYPPGSTIIKMAIDRGLISFEKIFGSLDSFTVSENERQLMIEGEFLSPKQQGRAYVSSFVAQLQARNLRSISFQKGLTNDEVLAFMELMSNPPEDFKKIEDVGAELEKQGVTHIELDKKVFVAIQKGQTVANISDLERLSDTKGGSLGVGDVKDGMFVQFLMSKLNVKDMNLSDKKFEQIKASIDFDRMKDAGKLDFEKAGPLLAGAIERIMEEGAPAGAQPVDAKGAPTGAVGGGQADQLAGTFSEISQSIVSFKNPEVRKKLLGDLVKVVGNFKPGVLAQVLSREVETPEGVDIKTPILASLPGEKQSQVLDLLMSKYQRVIDGLSPGDFNFSPQAAADNERTLMRLLAFFKSKGRERSPVAEKALRGLKMARLIKKEAPDPQSLMILKMRRLMVRPAAQLTTSEFLDHFPNVAIQLEQAGRREVVKKVLEKLAENLTVDSVDQRTAGVDAFVKLCTDFFSAGVPGLAMECHNHLYTRLAVEPDVRVFARMLASVVANFAHLVEAGLFEAAGVVVRSVEGLTAKGIDGARSEILTEALSRVTRNDVIIQTLLTAFSEGNQDESDGAARAMLVLPPDAFLPQVLSLLKTAEEMRQRKMCIQLVGKVGQAAIRPIVQELSREQPWYYVRNLTVLLGEIGGEEAVTTIARFSDHLDVRVRRVCVSALIKSRSPQAQQALADRLEDEEESIQRSVVTFFGQNASATAAEKLLLMVQDKSLVERDPELAVEVIAAVGNTGHPDAPALLQMVLKKGGVFSLFGKRKDDILVAVLSAFSTLGDPKGASVAKKFIRDNNPEVARAAQAAVRAADLSG
jgi:HEAT repeats